MKTIAILIACSLGASSSDQSGDADPHAVPQAGPVISQDVAYANSETGCGCAYCAGHGGGGYAAGNWVGNPYTQCSSCRRDGSMWPYDYRRAFDYPWHAPNYAWGSPFVPHAWWPEIQTMFGPGYPYAGVVPAAGDAHAEGYAPIPLDGGLLPIPSPPFPTPIERKILRID